MKYFASIASFSLVAILLYLVVADQPTKNLNSGTRPNDWFFNQRAYPMGKINYDVYLQSIKQTMALRDSENDEAIWEFAGPLNSGGRIADVESHPDSPEIFAGAASGGVFRLTADGSSWEAVFDGAMSLSVGDIAIAPSDPEILYVGTGEANCGGGSQTYDGVGVYKSTDGGDTWLFAGLGESRNIGRLVVHPVDPDIVYAAAMGSLFGDSPERGIYKTTDGGENWVQVLFISDSTGGIDLVIHPETPDVLYAAMWERIRRPHRRSYGGLTCGIYKTMDGGVTWSELTNGLPSPALTVGRIGIDMSRSDPDVLYAVYADEIGYFKGIYRSLNGGDSWTQTNDGELSNSFQSYGWWFGRIKVDPVDPEVAYLIGFDLYKTNNGGNSWDNISSSGVHVDQHELFIYPDDNNHLLLANDGGLYISYSGGNSWEYIDALPITQFYTCEIDEQFPERLYGGTQDNGTNRTLTGNVDDWEHIYGGDGFYVLVDPIDNNYVYAEYQYGGLGRSTDGGQSFTGATNGISWDDRKNWCSPVVFDPVNPEILYFGSNKVYRSANRAVSWTEIGPDLTNGPGVNLTYGTITTISVSPQNQGIIYAGTDDGNVWVSTDNGSWDLIIEGLPNRWVTRIAADPAEEQTVYVTFSGYRWNEYIPHIFRSDNLGATWMDISSNLPEFPLNDIIVDPEDNSTLYVASDAGVFVTHNQGESWEVMGANLPLTPVNDLDLNNQARKLVAATFGRSMYSYDLYQDTVTTAIRNRANLPALSPLRIFPNPISTISMAEIELSRPATIRYYLTDLSGIAVRKGTTLELPAGRNRISLELLRLTTLGKGIYILVVKIGDQLVTERMVISD